MSAQGHLARKPSDDSALLELGSANPVYQAIHAKPTNLACHLKQSSHVVEDHHTNVSVPGTKILHEGHDDKPTITLTVYEKENNPKKSLLRTITAIRSYADEAFAQGPDSQLRQVEDHFRGLRGEHEAKAAQGPDSQLKRQIEDHFRGLRGEFEAKTGRAWEPLRAWPAEEWEWTWDDG